MAMGVGIESGRFSAMRVSFSPQNTLEEVDLFRHRAGAKWSRRSTHDQSKGHPSSHPPPGDRAQGQEPPGVRATPEEPTSPPSASAQLGTVSDRERALRRSSSLRPAPAGLDRFPARREGRHGERRGRGHALRDPHRSQISRRSATEAIEWATPRARRARPEAATFAVGALRRVDKTFSVSPRPRSIWRSGRASKQLRDRTSRVNPQASRPQDLDRGSASACAQVCSWEKGRRLRPADGRHPAGRRPALGRHRLAGRGARAHAPGLHAGLRPFSQQALHLRGQHREGEAPGGHVLREDRSAPARALARAPARRAQKAVRDNCNERHRTDALPPLHGHDRRAR